MPAEDFAAFLGAHDSRGQAEAAEVQTVA